jgi:hypothetical protein
MDKLSADAAAARAAGMSYGNYMVMQYDPDRKMPEPEAKPQYWQDTYTEKVCKICGSVFHTTVHNKRCCSTACMEENNRILTRDRLRRKNAERKAKHG